MTPESAKRAAAKAARERFEHLFASQIAALRLDKPERQYRFAESIGRRWTADFGWPALMLLVEIEGGVWRKGGGAHSHPSNIERDIEKHNDATLLGWRVLRFTTDQVTSGDAVSVLDKFMRGACH